MLLAGDTLLARARWEHTTKFPAGHPTDRRGPPLLRAGGQWRSARRGKLPR